MHVGWVAGTHHTSNEIVHHLLDTVMFAQPIIRQPQSLSGLARKGILPVGCD